MSKYNVVFQGGGAKLFPLLAAVEAMQEQVASDNSFFLDTVAGTSAGSIAAMIYAAGVDTRKLRLHFKTESGKSSVMSAFPSPSRAHVIKSIALGRTIFDRTKLEGLLYKILSLAGYDRKKRK